MNSEDWEGNGETERDREMRRGLSINRNEKLFLSTLPSDSLSLCILASRIRLYHSRIDHNASYNLYLVRLSAASFGVVWYMKKTPNTMAWVVKQAPTKLCGRKDGRTEPGGKGAELSSRKIHIFQGTQRTSFT